MSRHPFRGQYRRAAIARGYARRWRAADRAELPEFCRIVNLSLGFDIDGPGVWEVHEKPRRREIILLLESGRNYRVTLHAWPNPWRPITVEEVTSFESQRPA